MTAWTPAGIFTTLGWMLNSIGLSVSDWAVDEVKEAEESLRIRAG